MSSDNPSSTGSQELPEEGSGSLSQMLGLLLLPLMLQAVSLVNANLYIGLDMAKLLLVVAMTWAGWSLASLIGSRIAKSFKLSALVVGAGIYLASFSIWKTLAIQTGWVGMELVSWLVGAAVMSSVIRRIPAKVAQSLYVSFFVILIAIEAPTLISAKMQDYPVPAEMPPIEIDSVQENRDLIIVILDGFGRADVLSSVYGYESETLASGIQGIGGTMLSGAVTNYVATSFSVPSILSVRYVPWPQSDLHDGYRLRLEEAAGGRNEIGQLLQENGYSYSLLESAWSRSSCTSLIDQCITKPFYDDLLNAWLPRATPFSSLARFSWGHPFPHSVEPTLDQLRVVIDDAQGNDTPDFVVAHVLSPHHPYMLEESCAISRSATYSTQAECVSAQVVEAIQNVSGETVIMIVGDHGPRRDAVANTNVEDWSDEDLKILFATLAAIRMPDSCDQPGDETTLINISRAAVACALGVELAPIENRVFVIGGDTSSAVLIEKDVDDYYQFP